MDVRLQNMFILLPPCFLHGILMINASFPLYPPPPHLMLPPHPSSPCPSIFFPPPSITLLCLLIFYTPFPLSGAMGGLFLDGEESVVLEDLSKWTVEDVCSFVGSLSGCAEYTQVIHMTPLLYMAPLLCSLCSHSALSPSIKLYSCPCDWLLAGMPLIPH